MYIDQDAQDTYVQTVKKHLREEKPDATEEEIETMFQRLDLIAQATYDAWIEARQAKREKDEAEAKKWRESNSKPLKINSY